MTQAKTTLTRSISTVVVLAIVLVGTLSAAAQDEPAGRQLPAITHNTWTSGAAMPTARMGAAAAAVGANIYVVDGYNPSSFLGVNEIYSPKKNTWTTGASDPNPRGFVAYALVNKILYVFGGSNGSALLDITESYNPATNTWTTLAPMPYVQETAAAVAVKDIIYVMGGQGYDGYLANVESYNITTNTWTAESPLLTATGWEAAGKLGASVVAVDGGNASSYSGNIEAYNAKKNTWSELTADPTPREPGCSAVIKGDLYVAGGDNGSNLTLNESYSPKTKAWTTLAPMPQGIDYSGASAEAGGRLYCFGGGSFPSTAYNNVQIYQP